MVRLQGCILKVDDGATVRGAFGNEAALAVQVEREPGLTNKEGKPYSDTVKVPDVPENRKGLVPGAVFDAPVTVSAVPYNGSAFISYVSAFVAKA